tara:strand:+ start:72 stop:686 length:615 start_codon:yes stop_codon:yes gene_type:complete
MTIKNSIIYSITHENYLKSVIHNKENKTQGAWAIPIIKTKELKYAYAYLANSNKMIVKRYEIEYFERNDTTKGYLDEDKQCFIFTKSEDVFFEYPYSPVQGRHYRNNVEMDQLPRLDKVEIENRLYRSQNYKEASKKTHVNYDSPKEQLRKELIIIKNNEYAHKPGIPVDAATKIIATAYEDPEQDLSALFDEYYLELESKNAD